MVERGRCEIQLRGGRKTILETGELAICFAGAAHQLAHGGKSRVAPIEAMLMKGRNIFRPTSKSAGHTTSLLCGVFLLHDTQLNPLFAEALRAHLEKHLPQEAGWFKGIGDALIGRAIADIHAQPGAA